MTGQLINAASRIAFLVTGKQKSEVVKDVITRTGNFDKYPASLVKPVNGKLYWYLDKNAAAALP